MIRAAYGLLLFAVSLVFAYKELREIQMNGYRIAIKNRQEAIWKTVTELGSLLGFGVGSSVLTNVDEIYAAALGVFGLLSVSGVSLTDIFKLRTKLKLTARAKRLVVVTSLIIAVAVTLVCVCHSSVALILPSSFCILLFARLSAYAGFLITYPFETLIIKKYLKKAKEVFAKSRAIKIAVTGSFGKTSCKNILSDILSKQYKVFATEKNYNTPTGLSLSSQKINGTEEVLIAEFGARRKGDINALCKLFKPEIGIITGVGDQHLATFGSAENVYQTKKELIDNLPHTGYAVFNCDNEGACRMREDATILNKVSVGLNPDAEIRAEDLVLSEKGSTFNIVNLFDSPLKVTTTLLGKHNVTNILLSAAVAAHLGVSAKEITDAVAALKPVPHRLELVEGNRSITIIDDSYNCNTEGAKVALDVLDMFKGRKVVYSQGIVELGASQKKANFALGVRLAKTADCVILSGKNKKEIEKGLLAAGFPSEKIIKFKDFTETQSALRNVLKEGDVFLIQNDLP